MDTKWKMLTLDGERVQLEAVDSASNTYTAAFRHGAKSELGHVVLLKDGDICVHLRPKEPRSISVSNNGFLVVADWIEYGKTTGADVTVYDSRGEEVYERHFESSSPLVDISSDGAYIVVCPYNQRAYIERVTDESTVSIHQYEMADRLNPRFVGTDSEPQIELSQSKFGDPLYRIDIHGNIVWHSDEFSEQQYYQTISFDETVPWRETIQKCASTYSATSDDKLKNIIANKIGEARLVDVSQTGLEEIVEVLEEYRGVFSSKPAHRKLLSQTLGNAYYRLAKYRKKGGTGSDEFWDALAHAGREYTNVLPWYEGKIGLAKVLRYQAKQYRKEQRPTEAFDCYKQIAALERQYDVELQSKADAKWLKTYTDQGLTSKPPVETGRWTADQYMHS
ncbi:hypothetical protein [Salinigranum halophilum]|uniref:hypothetical protein n=1 Tax=Salinigranum halophilum TaxID=2565931 RepID=UPI0010A8560D|nr:hypothetical protein [Salinigranum halophilum]